MNKIILTLIIMVAGTAVVSYKLIEMRDMYIHNSNEIEKRVISAAEEIYIRNGSITLDNTKELIYSAKDQDLALIPINILITLVVFFLILSFAVLVFNEIKSLRALNK